jgi:hypothetical protein
MGVEKSRRKVMRRWARVPKAHLGLPDYARLVRKCEGEAGVLFIVDIG